ncbi:MAG: hypothetical protein ABIT69_02400 [Sphingomicrobium sp.]
MPQAHSPILERIARVLAAEQLSANATGSDASAAGAVDARWPAYRQQALAVLHALREPDAEMVAVGDADIWGAMVRAALTSADSTGA